MSDPGNPAANRRLRLTIQYDGTSFAGWQLQDGARTVQGCLEKAISKMLGGRFVRVAAAGRTDSGVHARAQVVSFLDPAGLPLRAWVAGLNRRLPRDVAVLDAGEVDEEFDPRRWALGKRYVYRIWNGPVRLPLLHTSTWHVPQPLDLGAMSEAASLLVGELDFASFQVSGCAAKTTVRVVERLEVEGRSGSEVSIDITATAFLRHMARGIAGTLVDVGLGKLQVDDIPRILRSRDRGAAGRTAPARGLTLEEVYYGDAAPDRRYMAGEVTDGGREESP